MPDKTDTQTVEIEGPVPEKTKSGRKKKTSEVKAEKTTEITVSSRFKDATEELKYLVHSRIPLITVLTHEELRFLSVVAQEIAQPLGKELWVWSGYTGLIRYEQLATTRQATGEFKDTNQAPRALQKIEEMTVPKQGAIFILRDFHTMLGQAIPRQLKDMYYPMNKSGKTIIITAGQLAYGPGLQKTGIEPTIEKLMKVVDFDLLTFETIRSRIVSNVNGLKKKMEEMKKDSKFKVDYTEDEINAFARTLQGLTQQEIDEAICLSLKHTNQICLPHLVHQKKQLIKKSDILEFIDNVPTFDQVGGLDSAKNYFNFYCDQFDPEAKAFGVQPLKGILLLGVPGTGKSLLAKAVSSLWKLPLLRLDVGRVMSGIVGSSEARMRDALTSAQSMAPCVLWCDEIEKALSGTKSSNFSDSGTLSRVFGTLLTSMEESLRDVVIVATANDISQIPPELIRRFNEVFFVDLPVPQEREQIFHIHLKKRGRTAEGLGLEMQQLLDASNMYTGHEIEKSVQEAIARGWRDGKRQPRTEDIVGALHDTKPISKVMEKQISELRSWASDRARYASSLAAQAHQSKKIEIESSVGAALTGLANEIKQNQDAHKHAIDGGNLEVDD